MIFSIAALAFSSVIKFKICFLYFWDATLSQRLRVFAYGTLVVPMDCDGVKQSFLSTFHIIRDEARLV